MTGRPPYTFPSPAAIHQDYHNATLSLGELLELGQRATFLGRPDILATVVSLVDVTDLTHQWVIDVYLQSLQWLDLGDARLYNIIAGVVTGAPPDTCDLLTALTQRSVRLPPTGLTTGVVICDITMCEVQPGSAYTTCGNNHHFEVLADVTWFRGKPRLCPFCFRDVPARLHVNGITPATPASLPKRQYKKPGQKSSQSESTPPVEELK